MRTHLKRNRREVAATAFIRDMAAELVNVARWGKVEDPIALILDMARLQAEQVVGPPPVDLKEPEEDRSVETLRTVLLQMIEEDVRQIHNNIRSLNDISGA